MVAFGKKLKEHRFPEWESYYIDYKLMKKKVRQFAQQIQNGEQDRRHVLKEFSRMLDFQIENTVLFLLEQQGILAGRIEKLGDQREMILQQTDIAQIHDLREAYRDIGHDLLRLLFFIEINAIGIRKILKKFDKRFGYRFTDYYVTSRSNHPYSRLQQVFKHVGIGAVVGALSRNLADLQYQHGSYVSIYDQPAISLQDPVIDSIKSAVDRLTHSTNVLKFLGQPALIVQDEFLAPTSEAHVEEQRYHFMSLILNLVNTFLYMVNTYIIVPTADEYSTSLGAAPTVCGIIIGSMAVAQMLSSVYFSAWSNKSYFRPLVFSSVVLLLGNALYALAIDLNSISILLIGRLFCGLGSARAVNRCYISDYAPIKVRMQDSAAFVSASALGMACGPALAGVLQADCRISFLSINENTLPGWVMSLAWLAYLFWLWVSFREPVLEPQLDSSATNSTCVTTVDIHSVEEGLAQPLLPPSTMEKLPNGDQECDCSEETPKESHKPATNILSAYRLLTPSVKARDLFSYSFHFCTVYCLNHFLELLSLNLLLSSTKIWTA